MKIDTIPLSHGNKLANDYIQGKHEARGRYEGLAQDESTWTTRIAYLADRPLAADRERLANVLADYNRSVGNHAAALQHIDSLRSPDTLVVIGGQQSGLFSGPLLVIYKAITIIRQAREAAKRYNRPVVPVFWIAGEDHDYAEVDHIDLLGADSRITRLQLGKPDNDRISISHLSISEEEWEKAVRGLAAELPDTDLKPDWISKLHMISRESRTLSEAFARIMVWLFGTEGLVLVDSADASVRQLESPMWKQLILHQEELLQAYMEGKRDLERSGYIPQAEVHADGANLFYYHQGNRLLLYREGDSFFDRQEQVRLTRDQLLHTAELEPDKLSNNVLTRPLMQDYLFPVLAAVLGPGEVAYWGQLKEAFRCLRMQLPVIVPREGYTLLEPADQKTLSRHDMTVEEALRDLGARREQWLRSQETFDVNGEFADAEANIRRIYEPLIEQAGRISPVMQQLGETNLNRIIDQVTYFRNRLQREIESKHAVGLRQFDRLHLSLLPNGTPQERVYNVFAYLNRYGDSWLRSLLHQHQPDLFDYRHHYIVYL